MVVAVLSADEARAALTPSTAPVVVIPVHDAYDDLVQCLHAVLRHTAPDTDVFIIDDGSTDPRVQTLPDLVRDAPHRVLVWRREPNFGFVRTMNEAFAVSGRRDVVLLNSDVIVGPDWLTRLREAAYSDSRIATATPLSNHGTILSVPWRNTPSELVAGLTPEGAAVAVAAGSARLYPPIPTCVGHCTYIKRMALDVVGGFDEAFSPGYGEEVDFSQRCNLHGLAHVCADDVFVYHRGGASFGRSAAAEAMRAEHERIIAERYPFYHAWVAATASSELPVLASSIASAHSALVGLTIAIDATSLGSLLTGTQRAVIESTRALARHPGVRRIKLVLPAVAPGYLAGAFDDCPRIEPIGPDQSLADIGADIAYRPGQVFTAQELALLRSLGRRIVVSQLDFIAFNNPGYFPDRAVWSGYRDVTRLTLAVADGVTFLSHHTEREARRDGLVGEGQLTRVAFCGTDHCFLPSASLRPPTLPASIDNAGYVLCFGTDFRHKNRLFALRTFAHMRALGYRGSLVLAGPRVDWGSSRPAEAEYLLRHPALGPHVLTLGHVSEAERTWLYGHASLVLHPTLYEGFGLVPFEAAARGTPCLSSTCGSLAEILPEGLETIAEWDPEAVAGRVMALLGSEERRQAMVEAIRRRSREFTWDGVAGRLVEFFEMVCRARRGRTIVAVEGEGGAIGTMHLPPPVLPALPNGAGTLGIEEMYPREFNEAMRAIGQRSMLQRPVAGITVLAYRIASRLRSRVVRSRRGGDT
jgi:GT2 family glycosyltransferase